MSTLDYSDWAEMVAAEIGTLCRCDDDFMCACGAAAARDVIREGIAEIKRLNAERDNASRALAAGREKVARVEALCDDGVFNVREWGERGTPFSNGGEQAFRRIRAALSTQEDR